MNHNEQYYTELTGKFLAGEATPAQEEELLGWAKKAPENQGLLDEMEQVWEWSAKAAQPPPFEVDMQAAWSKIDLATRTHEVPIRQIPPSANVFNLRRWSVAAAVLTALGLCLWWFQKAPAPPQFVEIQTLLKEKRDLTLPDGSRIWLNENSKITYSAVFEKRQITLEGEAFFEVEKLAEKPFEIVSGNATTTVLGTSFNVRAYPQEDKIEVTVERGKVKLALSKTPEKLVILEKGESGIVLKKEEKVEKEVQEIINSDAWKTEKLEFNDTPLKDVIESLERYFNAAIEVSVPSILNCHYNGNFGKKALPEILAVITTTLNLTWEKTAAGYRINGEGCKPDN